MKKIPFDIKLAKKGAKVQTIDGRDVRIICYDRKCKDYPIVALVTNNSDKCESTFVYTIDGKYTDNGTKHLSDLVLLIKTKIIYINLFRNERGYFYLSRSI